MNAVILAVACMLLLSLLRLNVVLALFIGALTGGIVGGLGLETTLAEFMEGLGQGAGIALSYGVLGAFAVALAHSGLPGWLAQSAIRLIEQNKDRGLVRAILSLSLLAMAVASQNLIPVHIAFIPILIPPLLTVFNSLTMDRRQIACLLTFGLTATYMSVPLGFGEVYLIQILGSNLSANGLNISPETIPGVMTIPVLGMFVGLLFALFFSYRKPRLYVDKAVTPEQEVAAPSRRVLVTAFLAVAVVLVCQLVAGSMILGASLGFLTMVTGRIIDWREGSDLFARGLKMMAQFGFVMICAAGFAEVLRATGDIDALVGQIQNLVSGSQGVAAFLMLATGLLITMGIGSSFSTVPIVATLYVPLGMELGFSPMAIASLVGVAGALGDAGSPVSESTIGPTVGLNADGQHDHVRDSVIPTFLHFNIPLLLFGWIAAMVL